MHSLINQYIKIALEVILIALVVGMIAAFAGVSNDLTHAKEDRDATKKELTAYRELYPYDNKIVTGNDVLLATQKFKRYYSFYIDINEESFFNDSSFQEHTNFNFTGGVQTFIAPASGTYLLEVWGAQGGKNTFYPKSASGKGGYANGYVTLEEGESLLVHVGGAGTNSTTDGDVGTTHRAGGWNGGGYGIAGGAGGGGATDVRRGGTTLEDRIIVAGGAGGAGFEAGFYPGGAGGGVIGGDGIIIPAATANPGKGIFGGDLAVDTGVGQGATQTTGYSLGQGSNGGHNNDTGGGGGGYYGGYGGDSPNIPGGGGSGYIGGVLNGFMVADSNQGNGKASITFVGKTIPSPPVFTYTGNYTTFTAPSDGVYLLETWGAQGGRNTTNSYSKVSKGGYSRGTVDLQSGDTLYIYIGGAGADSDTYHDTVAPERPGGWNGGGKGTRGGAGGGGATDIRYGGQTLANRIIVAGGGGGAGCQDGVLQGGNGGGASGEGGLYAYGAPQAVIPGGTQTSGYALGLGQNYQNLNDTGGGGGGYYGGFSSIRDNTSGGGGSSYTGGVQNGITIAGINEGNGKVQIMLLNKAETFLILNDAEEQANLPNNIWSTDWLLAQMGSCIDKKYNATLIWANEVGEPDKSVRLDAKSVVGIKFTTID